MSVAALVATTAGCFLDPDPSGPAFAFDARQIDMALGRDTAFVLANKSAAAYGPIELLVTRLETTSGATANGPVISVAPAEIATLNPGESRTIVARIDAPDGTPDDAYRAVVEARVETVGTVAAVELLFQVVGCRNLNAASVRIVDPPSSMRQGDVARFSAQALDPTGNPVTAQPCWSVAPRSAGYINRFGEFVGYEPGNMTVVVEAGTGVDSIDVTVTPRGVSGTLEVLRNAPVAHRFTSDLWVHDTFVYTGTWGTRTTAAEGSQNGNTLYAWDISLPTSPRLTDSVRIDARVVNDVKIRGTGDLAVITHESSSDGQNGITLLDLTDPLHPTVITRFTSSLTTGVHNAWIDGEYVYLVVDGVSPTSGLRILDIRDPARPQIAAEFYGGSSFLHDVYVRDGLAFLSHWNAGLIILDVGNGVAGGSPDNPTEVSRILTAGGQTHNAWYWPAGGYVFVGEEDFGSPGIMHVVDVKDLHRPKEVATFRVPGTTPHNFWMDEDAAMLFLSWYSNGIRVLDVSGDLLGELEKQSREITSSVYNGPNLTTNWAPQLHNGLLYLSDMESGLWVLRFTP